LKTREAIYSELCPGPDLPIGYVDLSLGPQDPKGLQQTVVGIELITGIGSVR